MGVWFGAAVKPLSYVCSLAGVVCCATSVRARGGEVARGGAACVCAGRPWVGVSVIRDTDHIRTENYYIGSVTDMH